MALNQKEFLQEYALRLASGTGENKLATAELELHYANSLWNEIEILTGDRKRK